MALGALAAGYWYFTRATGTPQFTTQLIRRGDVVDAVGATGTVEAVTTVQVGTQVSGAVQGLYADFNSQVRKGQVIARLDPSTFQTQVDQARASLTKARADLDRLRLSAADAQKKRDQAEQLAAAGLIAQADLDSARMSQMTAAADVRSAEAQVTQTQASLSQAEVSLSKTVIAAPITGTVIARNVDVGQTVAASLQAPTLFVIAADLTKMQVNASINEADVGRVRAGQIVRFRVDAYPADEFVGTLSLVRLNPIVQQNVVTYAAVIEVSNPLLKLKPGMTATVSVEIAARRNVLRVPNAALRFQPTAEVLAAYGRAESEAGAESAATTARRGGQGAAGRTGGRGATGRTVPAAPAAAPLDFEQTTGQVWILTGAGQLQAVIVELGITDGSYTELLASDLPEGTAVVTGMASTSVGRAPTTGAVANPLMGPQRGPRGGGR
jgi:HlyD family secretion protein